MMRLRFGAMNMDMGKEYKVRVCVHLNGVFGGALFLHCETIEEESRIDLWAGLWT